jgi:4-hydroxybenzoate polyprenyltransferase
MHHNADHVFIPIGAYLGSVMTGASVLWAWIGTNQPQITAICGMVGAGVAIISFCRQSFDAKKRKADKSKK